METPSTETSAEQATTRRGGSWGAAIALLLILGIIILGAYHAFTERLSQAAGTTAFLAE